MKYPALQRGRHISRCCREEKQNCNYVRFLFSSFLAVLLELNNPGYSHYKSCCLDWRAQTGGRPCNLVSFSIPLGFTGRCLTLLAGYLLATLKATFLLTSQLGRHTYNVCTVDTRSNTQTDLHESDATQNQQCGFSVKRLFIFFSPNLSHVCNAHLSTSPSLSSSVYIPYSPFSIARSEHDVGNY